MGMRIAALLLQAACRTAVSDGGRHLHRIDCRLAGWLNCARCNRRLRVDAAGLRGTVLPGIRCFCRT